MGVYNPNAPHIIGQEWVPIRDEFFVLSAAINSVEQGHAFTLQTARTLQDGRFYLNTFPSANSLFEVLQVSVYPLDLEDQTGPVHSVLIPCTSGGISGNAFLTGTSISEALYNPSDIDNVQLSGGSPQNANADLYFGTNAYAALLQGKRILSVDVVYVARSANFTTSDFDARAGIYQVPQTTGVDYAVTAPIGGTGRNEIVAPETGPGTPVYQTFPLGEVTPFWSTTPMTQNEWLPWTYATLQRFELSAANRITLRFYSVGNTSGVLVLDYVALKVTYCEEKRIAVGSQSFSYSSTVAAGRPYTLGANAMPMRVPTTLALSPALPVGSYVTVLSAPDSGWSFAPSAGLNAVREQYAISSHPGVQVGVTKTEGETFTSEQTHILPQITLHTSSGPLTEVHVYGRQAVAQVYGSITATQEIQDGLAGGSTTWPWVRYVARRFGDTTVPLTLTGASQSVAITPTEFDALDEILDGWKEISLRFTTPPTMGAGTQPQFVWSAIGETSGNRWEVLGATAPAISGTPGNNFNQVPSPNQLSISTYGQPVSGASINMGWIPQYAPYVSATVDDQTSDAFIIFAQDMAPVTGFGITTLNQAISGIGLDCGLNPCCIPSQLQYNRLTWGLPANAGFASDDFNRVVAAGGWGTASDGKVWQLDVGSAANLSVNGSQGIIAPTVGADDYLAWVNVGGPNQDITMEIKIGDVSEGGGSLRAGIAGRLTDGSNLYYCEFRYTDTGTVELRIRKRVGGSQSDLVTANLPQFLPSPTATRKVRFQVNGIYLRGKVWDVNTEEPEWQITTTDTSLTTGNNAGAFVRDDTTTPAPTTFTFDNFSVLPPDAGFGYYEMQRMDTVETDWQTIMKATSVALTGFNDYEARVGILSTYRIRGVDLYGFYGPWSSSVSATIASPGVTIGCTGGHLLIFTSNEVQDGSINLAYSSVWEDQVEEGFAFPEASFVQLQAMYNRDFFTAFRPSERGGEQFQRTVLVQAAAISPETLADFTSLRDMAWANVSYICVRDEDGNRWLSTVLVPSGRVLRDRRLYMAPVSIIEVTATPSPVSP